MLITSKNLISCEKGYKQELEALRKILDNYENANYNNMYILIMNYLGHIEHYCGHEGLVYRLLNNFTFSLEKKARGELNKDNDTFKEFVEGRIKSIEFDIEHGYL